MKITRLHIILLLIAGVVAAIYYSQIQQEKQRLRELAAMEAARQQEQKRIAAEQRLKEQKKELATSAVAIAGEYWLIAKKERRDIAQGQETLRSAKASLGQGDFDQALSLAQRSIVELKIAPFKDIYYTVRKRDSLWSIARMPQHYGRGALWTRIWRANKKKIPDFDLIYPRQVLRIPKANKTSSAGRSVEE